MTVGVHQPRQDEPARQRLRVDGGSGRPPALRGDTALEDVTGGKQDPMHSPRRHAAHRTARPFHEPPARRAPRPSPVVPGPRSTFVDRLSHTTRSRLEDLVAGSKDGDETAEDQAAAGGGRSFFTELKADPGAPGLESLFAEVDKLQRVRKLELPADLFADVSEKQVDAWRARAAKKVDKELTDELKKVRGKEAMMLRVAEAAPAGSVTAVLDPREPIWPVRTGYEQPSRLGPRGHRGPARAVHKASRSALRAEVRRGAGWSRRSRGAWRWWDRAPIP
jgi:hypothetical protein